MGELQDEMDKIDCEGIQGDYTVQDDEGNHLDCIETDTAIGDWCIPCLFRKRIAALEAAVRDVLVWAEEIAEVVDLRDFGAVLDKGPSGSEQFDASVARARALLGDDVRAVGRARLDRLLRRRRRARRSAGEVDGG